MLPKYKTLDEYAVAFSAKSHKGGKTYIAKLIKDTLSALIAIDASLTIPQAAELVAKHLQLSSQGVTAGYLSGMCNLHSEGIDGLVRQLFQRIGHYVQDNGCWPAQLILNKWPEYNAMEQHTVVLRNQRSTESKRTTQTQIKELNSKIKELARTVSTLQSSVAKVDDLNNQMLKRWDPGWHKEISTFQQEFSNEKALTDYKSKLKTFLAETEKQKATAANHQ